MLGSHQYKKIAKAADSCDNAWSLALGLSLYKMEKNEHKQDLSSVQALSSL